MSRLLNLTGAVLGLVIVGVLVGALVVLLRGSGEGPLPRPAVDTFQSPIRTPTRTPAPPRATPTPPGPPATPTVAPTPVPRCTFAARPVPAEPGPPLNAYHFSEPQVVLTHTSAIGIAGWLPDGQRLLITRNTPGTNRHIIETFDIRTGKLHKYAEQKGGGHPFWLSQPQVVAFFDWEYIDKARGKTRYDLWVSQGAPEGVQRIIEGFPASSMTVDPTSGYLILFTETAGGPPSVPDAAHRFFQVLSLPLDPAKWKYPKYPAAVSLGYVPQSVSAARRPDGLQIAFYTDPYLFLVDTRTYQVCEVDLGWVGELPRWASYAQWSPDGHYLAMRTTARLPGNPPPFSHLVVLDTSSGELYQPDLDTRYVWDIAWAPNSQHLMVLGEIEVTQTGRPIQKLFLVDALTRSVRSVLSDWTFGGGADPGLQLGWSPDGRSVAIKCPVWLETGPTIVEDRLCSISTNVYP